MVTTAVEHGERLCKILGLDGQQVASINIKFDPNNIVAAVVEFNPDGDQVKSIIDLLEEIKKG